MIEFILAAALLITVIALVLATKRINEMGQETIGVEHTDHAKCIAHIAHYVGNEFAAQVLVAAADDFGSMDGQANLRRLAVGWQEGDGPVPALWLRDRADSIRGLDDEIEEYNLMGTRVI